jgi:hypothetical protein
LALARIVNNRSKKNGLVTGGRNLEGKKLACKESDWKMAGTGTPVCTRTRGNGIGRPKLHLWKKQFIEPMTSKED